MDDITALYTAYLLSSFLEVTATGLSSVLDERISHDKITRYLKACKTGGKALWMAVKLFVKQYRSDDACLIFDDTIIEKSRREEDACNTWHYNPTNGQTVKGINLVNCLYHSTNKKGTLRCPVSYRQVKKTIHYCELATKKEKQRSPFTKNEMFRDMFDQALHNQLSFRHVLADS